MRFVARRGESITPVEVERSGSGYEVRIGDQVFSADLIQVNGHLQSLRLADGRHFLLTHQRQGTRHGISFGGREVEVDLLDPLALKRSRKDQEAGAESARVTSIMPGRVVRVLVEPGAEVSSGDGLLILEAMKMENEIAAPRAGKVTAVHVKAGQTVESGAGLVDIE